MKLIKFKTKKDIVISCLLILLLLVFFASAVMLLWNITRARLEQASFDELRIIVDRAGETDVSTADDETDRIFAQYAELNEKNCDFTGWLTVDGTKIDYPVMCRPDDPSFYLHCDFDGDYSASGTPFLGAGSTVDSDCIIIHGHNMKNDTMFGTLDYYRDKSFCEKNSVIRLDTLSEHREYKVFAAVQCEVVAEGETGFKYYECGGDLSEVQYAELVEWLRVNSFYSIGTIPENYCQILILSTCSYQSAQGRFVVAAYRIK